MKMLLIEKDNVFYRASRVVQACTILNSKTYANRNETFVISNVFKEKHVEMKKLYESLNRCFI